MASGARIPVVAPRAEFEEIWEPRRTRGTGRSRRRVFSRDERVGAREQIIGLSFIHGLEQGHAAGPFCHRENLPFAPCLAACRHQYWRLPEEFSKSARPLKAPGPNLKRLVMLGIPCRKPTRGNYDEPPTVLRSSEEAGEKSDFGLPVPTPQANGGPKGQYPPKMTLLGRPVGAASRFNEASVKCAVLYLFYIKKWPRD
ncbi:hypothetical protein GWK47_040746 [Chionoecetes opilio]|uniref:Uncharacterized protein n=1 Tax=Chionoecetes opilio TaxID=41210 RepID=A0A8J4YID8_CHIOP|nr:hypothetical protein GWK47_040746 [Chionoecetes opilio]